MKRLLYYSSIVFLFFLFKSQHGFSQCKQISRYYLINKEINLHGGEIIFQNAVLDFNCGSIKNGTIKFEDVVLKGNPCFSNIKFYGDINIPFKTSWFIINDITDLISVFESFGKCNGDKHIIIDKSYTFDYSAFSRNQQVLFELTSNSTVEFTKKGIFYVLPSEREFHQNG